jgi:Zn-dependent membrane protease YugP
MALVVAIAGMILPAISANVLSIMIVLKRAPLFDELTLDVEFGFKFNVEDSSS